MSTFDDLVEALSGDDAFAVEQTPRGITFVRTDGTVVTWRVTRTEAAGEVARRARGARGAYGGGNHGVALLAEHIRAAVLTSVGDRGRLTVDASGVTVDAV
ncbi:hypothetical protein [Brevibacterium samyangense]|uniref:Uncharacterized protein n=1 Tax=Brevibacterium samyangense TaxID=366888 RepID=A0ABP5EXI1_9MICO